MIPPNQAPDCVKTVLDLSLTHGAASRRSLEPVDFEPEAILSFLKRERLWSTGLATLCFALVRQYGRSRVDRTAARMLAR